MQGRSTCGIPAWLEARGGGGGTQAPGLCSNDCFQFMRLPSALAAGLSASPSHPEWLKSSGPDYLAGTLASLLAAWPWGPLFQLSVPHLPGLRNRTGRSESQEALRAAPSAQHLLPAIMATCSLFGPPRLSCLRPFAFVAPAARSVLLPATPVDCHPFLVTLLL